jgi:hypothetical protein
MAQVATMGAEQQTLALAYMDTATAARAVEVAQIAASQAPGFEGLIQGAIAADPYLEAILTDMGVISRGAEGELIINTTGETEIEALTNAIDSLENTIVSVFVEVDNSELDALIQQYPIAGMGPLGTMGGGGGGPTVTVTLTAETAAADAAIATSTGLLTTWDGATGTGDVLAVNDDALGKIDSAGDKLSGWDASSGSADVNANDNASRVIATVSGALAALNGRTATTYINTVYTTTYQTVGSPGGMFFGHGGVVDSYATGGVVAEMGEWGPEMLHFPNGGVAMARTPGIYAVPQGTYVDTAPATAAKVQSLSGGINVTINVAGNVGVDDLTEQVTRQLVPAIQRAASQHMRSYGL